MPRNLDWIASGCLVVAAVSAAPEPLSAQTPTLTEQSLPGSGTLFIGVSAPDSQTVWLSGSRGSWARSTDGGATWQTGRVPGADSVDFRDVHALDQRNAWLLSIGNGAQSRIYRTFDGGDNWTLQFQNNDPKAFYDCFAFWDETHGVVMSDAVETSLTMRLTTDGGRSWNLAEGLPEAVAGEGHFAASGTCVIAVGNEHGWFGTGAGRTARVGRTRDRGKTWTIFPTPIVQNTATAGITSLVFADTLTGMILGGDLSLPNEFTDNVAVTSDGGETWNLAGRPPFPGPVYGAALVPGKVNVVVAVGPAGAAWTMDFGRSWSRLDDRNLWSVGFAPNGVGWLTGPRGRIIRIDWH